MGIRVDIKRTDFYNELSEVQQKQFFNVTRDKFLPAIDNIYYSLILTDDCKDNVILRPLLFRLDKLKSQALESNAPQDFGNGLSVDKKSFNVYKYCLTNPDLYDIFIMSYLPNLETPRILVQLRAYGLWQYSADKMIADSYNHVVDVLEPLGCTVASLRENRIDYCYHTNAIQNLNRILSDQGFNMHVSTTMEVGEEAFRIKHLKNSSLKFKNYLSLGNRSSNSVFFRLYNKALEVVEQGYKGFFFEIWQQKGLISMYDRYCLEKAYLERNYEYIHKAKLEFYIEYGSNPRVKKEFELALQDKNMTLQKYQELADSYMPELTTVINVEYETKRKFYYYSDEFIDNILRTTDERSGVPGPLIRLYKIMDNRRVFLDYLTSKTVSYRSGEKYAPWWKRLRNTKLGGLELDIELVRDYSSFLDEELAKRRFINSVVTTAVYNGELETDFISDISDAISNINDNHVHNFKVSVYNELDGTNVDDFYSPLLNEYRTKKHVKHSRIKNRKKKINETE